MAKGTGGYQPVRLDALFFTDPRFDVLGGYLGVEPDLARTKLSRVWSYCTDNEVMELEPEILRAMLGHPKADVFLVKSRLGRLRKSGKIYLRGSRDRLGWIKKLRKAAKAGGKAKAAKRLPKGTPKGMPKGVPEPCPPDSGLSTRSRSLSPGRAHARNEPEPTRAPPLPSADAVDPAIREAAARIWQAQEDERLVCKAEGIEPDSHGLGSVHPGCLELQRRLDEWARAEDLPAAVAKAEHILRVLFTEARAKRTLRHINGRHWDAMRAGDALVRTVEGVKAPPGRQGPKDVTVGYAEPSGRYSAADDFGDVGAA